MNFLSLDFKTLPELHSDEENGLAGRRKGKKRVRRRSGSLSRVLSAMGKGLRSITRSNTPSRAAAAADSIHSTPLPQFGNTPEFPSPRGLHKRKAPSVDHELSPSTKSVKRGFESTFTPKMRSRTFSVKRFKRKKSEGKLAVKEAFMTAAATTAGPESPAGITATKEMCSPLSFTARPSSPLMATSNLSQISQVGNL